jgi:hypothetical protein
MTFFFVNFTWNLCFQICRDRQCETFSIRSDILKWNGYDKKQVSYSALRVSKIFVISK